MKVSFEQFIALIPTRGEVTQEDSLRKPLFGVLIFSNERPFENCQKD